MNARRTIKSAGFRPIDWRGMFFDGSMQALFGIAIVTGALALWLRGPEAVWHGMIEDFWLLLSFTPKMAIAMCVAAFVTALVSRELIAKWLGEQAGVRGDALATGIGAITPGGPMIAFPLVNALHDAGTGRASLIAYLTSWEVLGFQRILIWELQFLGVELFTIRWLASVPLPFIAAFISRFLPAAPRAIEPSPPPDAEPMP